MTASLGGDSNRKATVSTRTDAAAGSTAKPGADQGRRGFLKLAGLATAGALGATVFPYAAEASGGTRSYARFWGSSRAFWRRIQNQFILDRRLVYMNIGTTGSMPRFVLHNYDEYNRTVARNPWDLGGDFPSTTDMRAAIAPGFGCEAEELWMSENTTNGLAQILNGIALGPDDVVLTTIHEHSAGLNPLYRLRDRYGIQLRFIAAPILPTSPDEYVQAFEDGILDVIAEFGAPPKLVFFTHTPYKTGATLPVKAICEMARFEYGCITAVDGAHNTGMLNLDFRDLGCDFYSGSGHKWQCGPGRTGIAYIRNQGGDLPEFWVTEGGYREDAEQRAEGDDIAGLLQSHGNPNYPAYRALHDSCLFWDEIGRQRIEDYVLDLSAYTKECIRDRFGSQARFYCPDVRELSSGLTTFNPFDDPTDSAQALEFRERLREKYGYVIRYTNFNETVDDFLNGAPYTYAHRISTHLFHDRGQIRGLVDAMYDLFQRMT
ncbi:selenocysteine lyase [Thioflavicoccus mobilis 8321]|uniref:Selenocysteine lyase n=2 Tax=Thioflavicoccus mobilis TaxID=80679 RepID=L0GZI0_9GAMM|nr:selenocysteine lyase [Thioflavicoccus mobilis 8321]